MGKPIELDHRTLDGRFSGDHGWSAQMKLTPNGIHVAYQFRLLDRAGNGPFCRALG